MTASRSVRCGRGLPPSLSVFPGSSEEGIYDEGSGLLGSHAC